MNRPARIAVVGASGFVGTAATNAAEMQGHRVVRVRAPRLRPMTPTAAAVFIESRSVELVELIGQLRGVDAVVNAAGEPDASARDTLHLVSVNGALPGLVARATVEAGIERLVHVSSAVVQGRLPRLDETTTYDAFSEYARSKVLGEKLALRYGAGRVVVYRPPSVHSTDRRVTRVTARIASSPLGLVASPGDAASPQALVQNVADAIVFLAACQERPPRVVMHPWEGLTTSDVMELLGGRRPRLVPRRVASTAITALTSAGKAMPRLAADARRVEMLWFGQEQAVGWLTRAGWTPPEGRTAWRALGSGLRDHRVRANSGGPQK